MTVPRALLLSLLLTSGCLKPQTSSMPDTGTGTGAETPDAASSGPAYCGGYSPSRRLGANVDVLPELSGLVASRTHAGIYWGHNDSGNALEIFAVREDGSVVAQIPLTGATNVDVEDLALAPCGAESCIFLGDFGDNARVRTEVALYRLREPLTLTNETRAVERLPFTYTDGAHNAESVVIDANSGIPYILTKAVGTLGDVYRVNGLAVGAVGSAVKVASVNAPNSVDQVSTAADSHPLGGRILVRTYSKLWELRNPAAASLEDVWTATPVEVPSASQVQSEAVAYRADGRGYVIGSEGVGEGLFVVDCRD